MVIFNHFCSTNIFKISESKNNKKYAKEKILEYEKHQHKEKTKRKIRKKKNNNNLLYKFFIYFE
jgi:hypothetical protein